MKIPWEFEHSENLHILLVNLLQKMQWIDHMKPNKQTFPVGSVTLAPMMSSFCLDLTLLSCKLFYSLIRDFDSKGSMRAMLDGCGPKQCTADCVDVNLWSHFL